MNEVHEIARQIKYPDQLREFAKIALSIFVDRDNLSGIQELEDRLICHAIMLATLDGFASTPNKVALVTGLNRTTVRRRVEKLQNSNVLLKIKDTSYVINQNYANAGKNVDRLLNVMRAIR